MLEITGKFVKPINSDTTHSQKRVQEASCYKTTSTKYNQVFALICSFDQVQQDTVFRSDHGSRLRQLLQRTITTTVSFQAGRETEKEEICQKDKEKEAGSKRGLGC